MNESRFTQLLAEAGPVLADRSGQLPAPVRALHRMILEHFAGTGDAPAPGTVREWAADAQIDARDALASLAKADLAEADPGTGRILGAYPFSAAPRGHRVDIAGGPAAEAYCALDALGIPALLGQDADITSTDPHSGTPIRIEVRSGHATWDPAAAVASMPADEITSTDQPAANVCCPTVNFFASADNANAYRQAHGLALEILTIPQALRFGSAAFGPLLAPHRR